MARLHTRRAVRRSVRRSVRPVRAGDMVGTIRRRLLLNQWVDPAEVEEHLPEDVRPHIASNGGVVVGCCLIEIDSVRPSLLPPAVGVTIRAAAHRIAVETGPASCPKRAVYVPVRQTDSMLAVLTGGRLFPGVHLRAAVSVGADARTLYWSVESNSATQRSFHIVAKSELNGRCEPTEVGDIVIGTDVGLSGGRRAGQLEAVQMRTARNVASVVQLRSLDSSFMAGFETAIPAETLLMTDTDVTWTRPDIDARDSRGLTPAVPIPTVHSPFTRKLRNGLV